MPRVRRTSVGQVCYHLINRSNPGTRVFDTPDACRFFLALIDRACRRLPMRLLASCVMLNHFHIVAWPRADGDLSRWMQWLLTAHVRGYHARHLDLLWTLRNRGHPI